MVAAREQSSTRWGAERRGVEAVETQPVRGKLFGYRSLARAAECTGCSESGVINQDHQDVGSAFGWPQLADRRKFCVRIFCVVGSEADRLAIRDRQYVTLDGVIRWGHGPAPCYLSRCHLSFCAEGRHALRDFLDYSRRKLHLWAAIGPRSDSPSASCEKPKAAMR